MPELHKTSSERETPPYISLLGVRSADLPTILGEPFSTFTYRGRVVNMFDVNSDILTCESSEGYVVSVDAHKERRTDIRIKPDHIERSYLRYSGKRHETRIIDISARGASLELTKGPLPTQGATVSFCTKLRTHHAYIFITLVGQVYRVDADRNSCVVLFSSPHQTHSHKALSDYINVHHAFKALKPALIHHLDEKTEVATIKSDLCSLCTEKSCERPDGYNDSDPIHQNGISAHAA